MKEIILVKVMQQQLHMMRDQGRESLVDEISSFHERHNIGILKLDEMFVIRGLSMHNTQQLTNFHHYHTEFFYTTIVIIFLLR